MRNKTLTFIQAVGMFGSILAMVIGLTAFVKGKFTEHEVKIESLTKYRDESQQSKDLVVPMIFKNTENIETFIEEFRDFRSEYRKDRREQEKAAKDFYHRYDLKLKE
jgi:hypothetical protein